MPGHQITCPYCFERFDDADVHFRMETVLDEDDLDPEGEGRSLAYIQNAARDDDRARELTRLYHRNELFLEGDDPAYTKFWEGFGGTTELLSRGRDGASGIVPFERPVIDPKAHPECFKQDVPEEETVVDGIVRYAYDCFGTRTSRRVCPYCHNPLGGSYGTHPAKFISVIGITGSGKTVYLSQLCKFMPARMSAAGISANPVTTGAIDYLAANEVKKGEPLPAPTLKEQLLQPLLYDFAIKDADTGSWRKNTYVFYDIAGENLQFKAGSDVDIAADAEKFGPFIRHSDAMVLLIDPSQFIDDDEHQDASTALTVIGVLFGDKKLRSTPLAVCISKADATGDGGGLDDDFAETYCEAITGMPRLPEMTFDESLDSDDMVFSAKDYNELRDAIESFVKKIASKGTDHFKSALDSKSDCYNYFMIESIGVPLVEGENASGRKVGLVPASKPNPQRIVEPILWILYKLGYIDVNGFINEPKDWTCPKCGKRLRGTDSVCPACLVNRKGMWKCPGCGASHADDVEWCDCGCNRTGEKRSGVSKLIGKLFGGR